MDYAQYHSESAGDVFEFLLVNPSTNSINANAGAVWHLFRPRTWSAIADSLDFCLGNDLTSFQKPFSSRSSDPGEAGPDADIKESEMTDRTFDIRSHDRTLQVGQHHSSSSIRESRLMDFKSDRYNGRRCKSTPYLVQECESSKEEWTGLPIMLSMKAVGSNMDALLSDVNCSSVPRMDNGSTPPPEAPDPMFWSALLRINSSTAESPSTPGEARY